MCACSTTSFAMCYAIACRMRRAATAAWSRRICSFPLHLLANASDLRARPQRLCKARHRQLIIEIVNHQRLVRDQRGEKRQTISCVADYLVAVEFAACVAATDDEIPALR
jgi:hypothetical protein